MAEPIDASPPDAYQDVAERSAALALAGIPREYPSKIAHVLNGPDDARTPRALTPVFYGCFDWHSAVHAHWTLARCCRCWPGGSFVDAARALLDAQLAPAAIAGEAAYMLGRGREGFERPYGLAWLLQLVAELRGWDDPQARAWAGRLAPIESIAAERLTSWLARLDRPVRTGEHSQTAFATGLALDWARDRGDPGAADSVRRHAERLYRDDRGWSLAFEPGGQDFLSPGLAEADVMRRVLPPTSFAAWLAAFLPQLERELERCFAPAVVTDPSDGKLAHLDGLNLSRAWMLEAAAAALPDGDERRPALAAAAAAHRTAGLAALRRDGYETTHWLGTFAVYLVSDRGRCGGSA